jgi:hypothetical protein
MTAEIEADLKSAQESAINASVAGLKTSAKIDSIKVDSMSMSTLNG